MQALTISEASSTTGWSARMLRYVETLGLVEPARSATGYRLYGPEHLQRLRTLRELLDRRGLSLGEVGFAGRLRRERELRDAVDSWFRERPERPETVAPLDWLRWEQDKHEKLLSTAGSPPRHLERPQRPGRTECPERPVKESA